MGNERTPGKPTTRRYSDEEKDQAVRMVLQLRKELGHDHGTIGRVANQLGIGVESVRTWVKQRQVDLGEKPGVTTAEAERIKVLEQENRELCRRNRRTRPMRLAPPAGRRQAEYVLGQSGRIVRS